MSTHSAIEWTDATWNPVTGCSKVSQGCKHCYAEREWMRLSAPRPTPNLYTGRAFTDVQVHRERLTDPLRWSKPRRIFVNSMSDLFHDAVSWEFLDAVFAVMALCQGKHTFQILTKRPQRMRDYFGERPNSPRNGVHSRIARRFSELARNDDVAGFQLPLPNVWLGVSIEDQDTADARIPALLQTSAAVRFISAEPLLGPINIKESLMLTTNIVHQEPTDGDMVEQLPALHWVIAGGESGPNARPTHPDWFRALRDQCTSAGHVPFFFKQWGEWAPESIASSERAAREAIYLQADGSLRPAAFGARNGATTMQRNGKRNTGRQLDGRTHDEYPTHP